MNMSSAAASCLWVDEILCAGGRRWVVERARSQVLSQTVGGKIRLSAAEQNSTTC